MIEVTGKAIEVMDQNTLRWYVVGLGFLVLTAVAVPSYIVALFRLIFHRRIRSLGTHIMGACFPGNKLRNAGRQESRKAGEAKKRWRILPLFLHSCLPHFNLGDANQISEDQCLSVFFSFVRFRVLSPVNLLIRPSFFCLLLSSVRFREFRARHQDSACSHKGVTP